MKGTFTRILKVQTLMVVLATIATPVFPAETGAADTDSLVRRIEALETELASLKELVKQQSSPEQSKPPNPVEFGGTAYMSYSFDNDGADRSDNRFAVDRFYFNTKKRLTDRMSLRLTTDIATRVESSKTKFNTYVKYAYVKFDRVVPNGDLIFGAQATPWVGNEEKAWKYRSVRKVLADDRGFFGSGDFGLSLQGTFDEKRGDYHAMLSNGEGYGSEEETANANAKDFTARVSYSPAKNAPRFSLYGDRGSSNGAKSNRLAAMLNQQIAGFSYGLSFIHGVDGSTKRRGLSVFGNYDITNTKWSLLARYDRYDPDRSASGDIQTLRLAGFSYRYSDDARLIVSYHLDRDRALAESPAGSNDTELKAIVELNY